MPVEGSSLVTTSTDMLMANSPFVRRFRQGVFPIFLFKHPRVRKWYLNRRVLEETLSQGEEIFLLGQPCKLDTAAWPRYILTGRLVSYQVMMPIFDHQGSFHSVEDPCIVPSDGGDVDE